MEEFADALTSLQRRTVRVSGEGVVEAAPDAATISVGVYVSKASQKKAREEAAVVATAIIAAIKAVGIPTKDIQTGRFSVHPQRSIEEKGKPVTIIGYSVLNNVVVTVRNLELLSETLDAALAMSASQVSGPDFFLQHPGKEEDAARQLAMQNARHRAEVLAEAAGQKLGNVISIIDGNSWRPSRPRAMMADYSRSSAPTPIETGTEAVTANVEVVWEMLPC